MPHSISTKRPLQARLPRLLLAVAAALTIGSATTYAQSRVQPGANPIQPGANPGQPGTNPNPRPRPNNTESQPNTLKDLNPDVQSDQPILATERQLDSVPRLLSDKTWQEYSYGLSFKVPNGAVLDPTVTPQRVAAVMVPDKYEITVQILPVQAIVPNSRGQIEDIPEDDSAFMPGRIDRGRQTSSGKRLIESNAVVPVLDADEVLTIKDINKIAVNQQLRFLKAENYGCFKVRMFKDLVAPPPPPFVEDPEIAKLPGYVPPATQPQAKPEPGFTAYISYFSYLEKRANAKNTVEAGKDQGQSMVMGELVVMLSPKTFLSVRLRTNASDLEKSQQVFESLLSSFKCMSQDEMIQLRKKLLEDGEAAIAGKRLPVNPQAYPGRLWFRVMEGDKDVGYMRITDGIDTVNKLPGVRVLIETKTFRNNIGFVGESDFFLPHDQNLETWSIKLAEERPGANNAPATPGLGDRRPANPSRTSTTPPARTPAPGTNLPLPPRKPGDPPLRTSYTVGPPPPLFWSETGTFDSQNKSVVVTRQTTMKNASNDSIEWKTPAVAYLGQVQSLLIQRILPTDKPGIYGFYCYNPQAGNIFFRTERVVPDPSGKGCTIYTRASPEQREIVSQYDELGRLLQRDLPNGQSIRSVNPNELPGIWSQKGLK
jgi:hypothetical protein